MMRPRHFAPLAAPRFTLHASRFRRCALVALLAAAFALVPLPAGGARAAEPALPTGHVGRHGDRPDALGRARAAEPTLLTGVLGEAAYRIQVPPDWNGTLVLYSHGYVPPGVPNPALSAPDPVTGGWLLDHGYALAGSAFSASGWAVEQALPEEVALLDFFAERVGAPKRTIVWGQSLGGMIAAGLLQRYPERFAGALPMCGVLAGGVGAWNESLDSAFALKTLLAPDSDLEIVHITDGGGANLQQAQRLLTDAQATPRGRARLALVAALTDLPGWFDAAAPEPAKADFAARQRNQFLWMQRVAALYVFGLRAELEVRAGGNPSWNTGVDYGQMLAGSTAVDEVRALYRGAGLSLDDDLRALERAPRIAADSGAVDYLTRNIVFDGRLPGPVLTLHTTDDGLVRARNEQAYADVVRAAGDERLLRQVFVHRAGHCAFTPAEMLAAFQALIHRLDTGRWEEGAADTADATGVAALNRVASSLGPDLNATASFFSNSRTPTPPAFARLEPSPYPRPFDLGPPRPAPSPGPLHPPATARNPASGWHWLLLAGLGMVALSGLAAGLVLRLRPR